MTGNDFEGSYSLRDITFSEARATAQHLECTASHSKATQDQMLAAPQGK